MVADRSTKFRHDAAAGQNHPQHDVLSDAIRQFEEAAQAQFGEALNTSIDIGGLLALPDPTEGSLRDLHQSLTSLVEGVVLTNLRSSQDMLRVTTHSDFVALQQRFMRDYCAALLQGSAQLISTICQVASRSPAREPVADQLPKGRC